MCVGDSITDGYGLAGSYRKYLYQELVANGSNVDMVGLYGSDSETYYDTNTGTTLEYDGNYTAVSGYAIQQMTSGEYRNGIYETIRDNNVMATCQPDIVLLQIGTNDIISNYNDGIIDRLENLVDYLIDNMDDDGVVFVTTIPYMDATNSEVTSWFAHYDDYWTVSTDALAQEINDYVDSYNTQIKEMVARKISEGCTNVQFADVNSVLDAKTELRDGVHPTDAGYQDMAEYWSSVVTSYLSGKSDSPSEVTEATTVTTEVTTVSSSEPTTTPTDSTEATTVTDVPTSLPTEDVTTTTEDPYAHCNFDVNGDGKINVLDLVLLKKKILGMI
jgi:lysophospholipase L1-like esterase